MKRPIDIPATRSEASQAYRIENTSLFIFQVCTDQSASCEEKEEENKGFSLNGNTNRSRLRLQLNIPILGI